MSYVTCLWHWLVSALAAIHWWRSFLPFFVFINICYWLSDGRCCKVADCLGSDVTMRNIVVQMGVPICRSEAPWSRTHNSANRVTFCFYVTYSGYPCPDDIYLKPSSAQKLGNEHPRICINMNTRTCTRLSSSRESSQRTVDHWWVVNMLDVYEHHAQLSPHSIDLKHWKGA
jgi:hypothetical protein